MKPLFSFCLILLINITSTAQLSPAVAKYNLPKKRLLIQACAMYLYNANQGTIDVDSSVVLACKAYKLPVSLAYDEDFNDGSPLIGRDLIEKEDINSIKKLLISTKG